MQNYYGDTWVDQGRERKGFDLGVMNAFLQQVYIIMGLGLGITGMVAYFVGQKLLGGEWLFLLQSPTIWIVTFSPFVLVMVLSFGIERMSSTVANIVFAVYATLMGLSLSTIFLVYSGGTIASTFFITAGMFGGMAVIGMTTKADLSKFRSILMMGLFGIIIASVVNIFIGSSMIEWIISIVGVVLFCGLTAYDTQKLMEIGQQGQMEGEKMRKIAVMGALTLYLDFINLFLFLLRLFGGKND